MRLFKFVASKSAILSIASGSLKFTPIDDLNDPSELTPGITVTVHLFINRMAGLVFALSLLVKRRRS
jgi:hypothetical protein